MREEVHCGGVESLIGGVLDEGSGVVEDPEVGKPSPESFVLFFLRGGTPSGQVHW
jgi:hypothetical protein